MCLFSQEYIYPDARDRVFLVNFHKTAKKKKLDIAQYNKMKDRINQVSQDSCLNFCLITNWFYHMICSLESESDWKVKLSLEHAVLCVLSVLAGITPHICDKASQDKQKVAFTSFEMQVLLYSSK